jgi:hypothetical protein
MDKTDPSAVLRNLEAQAAICDALFALLRKGLPRACRRVGSLDRYRPARARLAGQRDGRRAGAGRSRGRSVAELYNEQRPHGAIGNKVPAALMKSAHEASPCC